MDIMELEDCAHYVNNLVKLALNQLPIVRLVWMDIHFSSLQINASLNVQMAIIVIQIQVIVIYALPNVQAVLALQHIVSVVLLDICFILQK
jgi:hypothetical protein